MIMDVTMLDLYEIINRHIIFPFYYWKSGDKRLTRLQQLEKNQYLSREKLAQMQLEKLQSMIAYAYQHTRYYRREMDARGITPDDINSLQDIEKLPLLTKKIIQQQGDELLSDEFEKSELIEDASGGSTGEPTVFYKDLARHNLRRADQLRHDRWSGWNIGKPSALIWGAGRDLKALDSFREFIISRYIARSWELDAFDMTPEKMDDFVIQLEKIKPAMILGYANALYKFSQYLLEKHPNHNIKVSGIISSAETLTPAKRDVIERAFHCQVLNRYGSREVGLIASECKNQTGLHINADNIYLEVTEGERPLAAGQQGDVIITDFYNKAMPMIRYKLEDVGVLADHNCDCAINLPLLQSIEGRCSDFFIANNGKLIHGEYFTHLFYGIKEIKQFQLIQHTLENIELKLVIQEPLKDENFIANTIAKIKKIMDMNISVEVKHVDAIPPTRSGKHLFTISKVH